MRLRDSIRPPQRFNHEELVTLGSQQPVRQASSQLRPRQVDFNPNLPAAAFPTLERSRAGEENRDDSNNNASVQHAGEWGRPGQDVQRRSSQNEDGTTDKEMRVEFEDLPIDAIENKIASNGDLNPVYARNMAIMANPVGNPYKDMEDSDQDDVMADIPAPKSDLSPGMQVEIFNNLIQSHSFSGVCHMLRLTIEECNKVRERLDSPNEQIQLENSELEDMRGKQVRALMRIDNSALRQNKVPHQLVFRKTSRQCTRRLRESIGMDYLLCESGDLLNARRFLHKRGINRSYAGDWSNNMVTLRAPNDDSEPETFEWKEDLTGEAYTPGQDAVVAYTPTPSKEPRLSLCLPEKHNRESFINDSGKALDVNPWEAVQRKGNPYASPRWLEQYQSQLHNERFERLKREHARTVAAQNSGLVCLKIGVGRAAQIRSSERSYLDKGDMFRPSCGTWYRNKPSESKDVRPLEQYAIVGHPVFPNTRPVITGPPGLTRCPPIPNANAEPVMSDPQPVRRVMGGNWSYNSVELSQNPQISSFSRARQRLEAAKQEEQQKRAGREHGDPNMVFAQMTSPSSFAADIGPQLPTPPSPELMMHGVSLDVDSEQEAQFSDDEEDPRSNAIFQALVKEFLDFGSDDEPEDVPAAAPVQDDTSSSEKWDDSSDVPPMQDIPSGDPRLSLPTPASATQGSGDERTGGAGGSIVL
ncbi:hypothetical protein PHISP_02753 [Aspergillus sp. HF37]|nr:hypothetical protein PHISP_02753 [Aspergillus sp. HF37]